MRQEKEEIRVKREQIDMSARVGVDNTDLLDLAESAVQMDPLVGINTIFEADPQYSCRFHSTAHCVELQRNILEGIKNYIAYTNQFGCGRGIR